MTKFKVTVVPFQDKETIEVDAEDINQAMDMAQEISKYASTRIERMEVEVVNE